MAITDPELDIPFDHWGSGSDEHLRKQSKSADSYFPGGVVFNTYQLAIQASLELMGTRTAPIPVILPITASPETIAAVLRSGASPVLLDVDYLTLQMNPTQLQEALEELKDAIVLLTVPGGQPIDPGLLKQVQALPTIIDTHLVPDSEMHAYLGSFTVYDLSAMCGSGGVVFHKYLPQLAELTVIRSGMMGHSGKMSWPQVNYINQRASLAHLRREDQASVANLYSAFLQSHNKSGMIVFKDSPNWPYYLVRVPDARRVVAHLQDQGVQAVLGCYPLHLLDELKDRWQEEPQYPTAVKLMDEIVALPTFPGVYYDFKEGKNTAKQIISLMLEVT